jgi:hypothetical protein
MSDISLLRARYLLTEAFAELLVDGVLAWRDGEIVAAGSYAAVRQRFPDAPCKSFPKHLVMPGLVNAHGHGRGVGTLQMGVTDEPLEVWISGLFALRALDPYLAALYDGLTLLASGVTTTTHQHNPCDWQALEQEPLDVAAGYRDTGCRVALKRGLRHFPGRSIYWSGSIRALNNSMPARPNMARLRVFNRLIWPSAWPLLHGSAMAFLTASMSRASIRANCCRAWMSEWRASSSEEPSLSGSAPRKRPRKRIASPRMTTKLGEASFKTVTLAA